MFDYIVVGAGAAGCVLANRLTEDPSVRVLLLEAGGEDSSREIRVPMFFTRNFQSPVDWSYFTEEEAQLENRKIYWPRGKVLGGSSSINAMIYIRGNHKDYDGWRDAGNPGWGFSDVLPYFRKSENQERGASEYHGSGGPLNICDHRSVSVLSEIFIAAAEENGFPRNADFNGASQEGFGIFQLTQKKGERHSAADAFLRPALRRPNLTVRPRTQVSGISFEGRRATGVRCAQNGGSTQFRAEREVILCGGTIGSAQLLLLSGIGPADHLKKFNIPVVSELPGVGANLQDHFVVGLSWECTKPVGLGDAETFMNRLRYRCFRRGPLTSNIGEAGAFLKLLPDAASPDLQFHFAPNAFYDRGPVPSRDHFFSLIPTLIRPRNTGHLGLRSVLPSDPPQIQANYLADSRDVDVLVEGIKLARKIAGANAFSEFRGREICPGSEVQSDEALRGFVRKMGDTLFHPVGTCRMGSDAAAVVDSELRVHGAEALRVVDASIMPFITSGNTYAPTLMIAEKGADLIKGAKA